jgi:PKD repeat protein
MCMLMICNAITTIFYTFNVKVNASEEENYEGVGLDYDFIYNTVTKYLSEIIFDREYSLDNEIWKGRCFGTKGERESANAILTWITQNTDNLDVLQIKKESVGDESDELLKLNKMKRVNNNLEILGYSVDLREGYSSTPDVIIPNNESFPFPKKTFKQELEEHIITSNGPKKIHWPPIGDKDNPQSGEDIDFSAFNLNVTKYIMSFTLLNTSETFIIGETTYLENYSNATVQEIEGKIHLINFTNDDYNNTVEKLYMDNATGFILMRNNISVLKNWSINLSGVAVSQQNGSRLKNFTQNGTLNVFVSDYNTSQGTGILEIYHSTDNISCLEKEIYLVNSSWLENRVRTFLRKYNHLIFPASAFLLCSPDHPQTHFQYPYSSIKIGEADTYSYLVRPMISINGSVILNGQNKDVWEWVEENYYTDHPVTLNYEITQRKNPAVISYNVYCDIQGKNTNEWFLMSGGHYDGWYGQMTCDNAVGVAQMLGILKYLNDNEITPKYNTRFIFHSGEENVARGSISHVYNISNRAVLSKAKYIINLCQLGHKYPASFRINTTRPRLFDKNLQKIVEEITTISGYDEKYESKGYKVSIGGILSNGTTDCVPYTTTKDGNNIPLNQVDLQYINFCKDSFPMYHQTGVDHTLGDTIDEVDREDINATVDIIWNVSKYFIVDPDCWFNTTPSHQLWDSNHDSRTDAVNVSFSVNTILPQDRIWVKATLYSKKYPRLYRFTTEKNYIITSAGIEDTLTVTLPRQAPEDWYYLKVYLYNSTGEIDRKCHPLISDYTLGSTYSNDEYIRGPYQMYPANLPPLTPEAPTGDDEVLAGIPHIYSTSTTDPESDPVWYQWKYETSLGDIYSLWATGGPHASGQEDNNIITWLFPGTYNVWVRAKYFWNPNVMSNWSEHLSVTVSPWFGNPVTWNTNFLDDLSRTTLAVGQETSSNGFAQGVTFKSTTRDALNWTWEYGDGNCSYGETASHNYSQIGNYTIVLHIRNSEGYYYNCSKNVTVLILNADFTTGGEIQAGKTALFNDTSAGVYQIVNWTWDFGDGNISYQRNTSHEYTVNGVYNVTLTIWDSENNTHTILQQVVVENTPSEFIHIAAEPEIIGFGFPVTISADIYEDYVENQSGVRDIWVNITYPDNTTQSFPMGPNVSSEHDYIFTFNDTWQIGVYNYSIYVNDYANNINATGLNFTVSAEAAITVCTTKDTYTDNQFINLTDPPGDPSPPLGYELLDDGAVLHLWNQYDSYYFNTSSGIHLTNHKDQYWSRNVLMLGYYNNDQWNLLYRTDELTGFNRDIEIDESSFVNVTLWKDLSYGGYSFRLAIRYHLGVNDNDLTVIPYIKNIGSSSIPYVLGFGWELRDIQINMTTQGDYILVDQDKYLLNQTLDNSYTSLNDTVFYLMEDVTGSQTKSLYLRWNPDLNYKLLVKSRSGQQNAPVTLFIRVGTLAVGQQKYTLLRWYDASQETFYFNGFDENEAWEYDPELMIDESEETFASTQLDGSVQLCNGNTCPGDDRGTILKVELRVHGYYEGRTPGNITLRPVFRDGELIGENYTFVASDRPEWSDWFDIIGDGGHGSGQWSTPWSWSEISTLDCEVKATLGSETTLFCSKVELRVTYNTAPVVSNPSPPYGVNGVGLQPWVNITIYDPDGDSMNVTWYSNSTPSLLTLRPNANGSSTQLSRHPGSAAANYLCVDEAVADDVDYVYWSGTTWKKDTYNLANRGTASGVIHDVRVYVRCGKGGKYSPYGMNNSAKITIKSGSNYYYGNEFSFSSAFSSYDFVWSINPATETAWTWSEIDSLQAGISFIGNKSSSMCSQVYVVVNYTNPNTWLQFGQNSSISNGVYRQRFLNASVNGQWWYWKVKADDGTASTGSSVYKFYTGYQSKIENTGETTIKGYLLMQVQYYNQTMESWIVDNDTVNETTPYIISSSSPLGLDTIFNGQVRASDLTHGTGTYRVYAAFRDPEGNILNTSDQTKLEAWWQFSKT